MAELGDTDETDERIDQAARALEQRYTEAYRHYGDRFGAIVTALAADLDLPIIQVEIDDDPESCWWEESAVRNPDPWGDPVVDFLWQRAHDITPLPNVLIEPTDHTRKGNNHHGNL